MRTSSLPIERFAIAGKPIRCPHCQGTEFSSRQVLMNTRGVTFFNLDWLNRGAFALTCQTCGRIEWFSRRPDAGG
ncbi:hypothetical protein [Opitutus terrae]|uniref:DNA-binding protein n=1 Tax=Opitutus terrae (strain DSM 11246 / JCM 15787 / PB90-1) TaxID=452637 RepID=B1ZP81_OPITP|nr:hypothetical protein [Opitutus terrae]ACB77570.1 hypothetical protein Oter_4297 [Opitutus terrae PB90-1]